MTICKRTHLKKFNVYSDEYSPCGQVSGVPDCVRSLAKLLGDKGNVVAQCTSGVQGCTH